MPRRRPFAPLLPALVLALWFAAPSPPTAAAAAPAWQKTYGELLAKYATPGGVRYAAWKADAADVQALDAVVAGIGRDVPTDTRDERLAFYLNAYNAWVLKGVLDAYPIKGIRDVAPLFGFFTRSAITVSGNRMSLNKLEKEVIIPTFREPRVHFALNCASRSCPPLRAEPFAGGRLGTQLDEQAAGYVSANPLGVKATGREDAAELSQIFEWYAKDFAPSGGAVAFINRYRKEKLPEGGKISFQKYDWSLNEAR